MGIAANGAFQRWLVSFRRLHDILDLEEEPLDGRDMGFELRAESGILARGVACRPGGHSVYEDLDLELGSRGLYVMSGESGKGKTTFFRVLLGLEQPDAGSVALTVPSSAPSSPFSVSAVFQEDRLCEGFSPIDNIRLAVPGLSTASIRRELAKILPEGCLTRPVATLSGGMKRRTAIARALLAPSDMIVMDEPFTGLDEENRARCLVLIREAETRGPVLLASHDCTGLEDAPLLRLENGTGVVRRP